MTNRPDKAPACPCFLCRAAAWVHRRLEEVAVRLARRVVHSQPIPVELVVIHLPDDDDPEWTVITRRWAEGDGPRCRLCPRDHCTLSHQGTCMLAFPGKITPGDASLHAFGSPRERGLC